MFVACTKKQATISYLPVQNDQTSFWSLLNLSNTKAKTKIFKQQPSPVINNLFTIPDTAGLLQLYNINNLDTPVCTNKFSQIGYFFEEVTFAQQKAETPLLLIDKKGNTIKTIEYPEYGKILMAHNFKEGLALIYTENKKYGYINTKGDVIIKPYYDYAYDFSEGVAIVGIANTNNQISYSVINRKGAILFNIQLQNSRLNGTYSCDRLLYKNQHRCAYLDKHGNTALFLSKNIIEASEFKHNTALALTAQGIGFIAKDGKITIPCQYEQGRILSSQRAAIKKNGKWGLTDLNGKQLTNLIYDDISEYYHNNLAIARIGNITFMIDKQGQAIDTIHYKSITHDPIAIGKRAQVFTYYAPQESTKDVIPEEKAANQNFIYANNPFSLAAQKIISGQLSDVDSQNRKIIIEYMEKFRNAYITKDIDFLEQLFSEDALIIVGKVIKKAPEHGPRYLSSEQIIYNLKNKREYINRLKAVFKANKKIQINFSRFQIKKHPTISGIYGATVRQGYTSDLYSDEGYLFLLWDFRNVQAPQIHVRTWQPTLLDNNTPLPEQEIFSIRNFNIE